ncbi:MAG: potassium transporter Trk [Planctomycetes bacterium]|nr:potassium transporter Trk [Planctomycetota bacterium]
MQERPNGAAGYTIMPSHRQYRPRVQAWLDVSVVVAGVLGVAALLLEYGFYHLPTWLSPPRLLVVQYVAACCLLAERVFRCLLAEDCRAHLRRYWVDGALPIIAVLAGFALRSYGPPLVLASKCYILAAMFASGVRGYLRAIGSGIHPPRLLVGSFAFCILFGTGLLLLPRATCEGEPALQLDDAIFTATSATCVTGLIVRDTGEQFSRFGQTVILCLIQAGGLGIMIFGTLFIVLGGRSLDLRQTAAVGESIGEPPPGQISRMVKFIVLSTLGIEAVGVILLRPLWPAGSAFAAVFHSVSAFCNAGFALQSDNFTSMRDSWQVLAVVPLLIILGGLGFPVLMDIARGTVSGVRYSLRRHRQVIGVGRVRWRLQTKIVLATSLLLVVLGTAGLVAVEPGGSPRARIGSAGHLSDQQAAQRRSDWQAMPLPGRIYHAYFQAVTARTAGFNTINLDHLSGAGKLWIILLMLIGGSPASTAGGMKTVTFAILVMTVWATLRRREQVEAFGRSLPANLLRRAMTLAVLYFALVAVTTLALSIAQGPRAQFMDVLFESASACGTVGLSLGETARLTVAGKFIIIGAMFIGGIGPLTLLMGLTAGSQPGRYRYPQENLIIG